MRAATRAHYGPPRVLEVAEIDPPRPEAGEVLIEVRAAAVNPFDWHMLTGTPLPVRFETGLARPKDRILGSDAAGVVVEVGPDVSGFEVGDQVFGGARGSFAELAVASTGAIARKPASVSFEAAAALPIAGLTALQALRDKAGISKGTRIAVNGAAGGVGTYAVQLARLAGARVTAVCSTANVEMLKRLGAHEVVDYTRDDFTATSDAYDVLLDNQGNRRIAEVKRCLTDDGIYVVVGGKKGKVLGAIAHMLKSLVAFRLAPQTALSFIAQHDAKDLETLAGHLEKGEIVSEIERTYPLDQVVAALEHLETGHVKGKIVVAP